MIHKFSSKPTFIEYSPFLKSFQLHYIEYIDAPHCSIQFSEYCIDLKTGLKISIINDSTNINIKIIIGTLHLLDLVQQRVQFVDRFKALVQYISFTFSSLHQLKMPTIVSVIQGHGDYTDRYEIFIHYLYFSNAIPTIAFFGFSRFVGPLTYFDYE